MKIKKILIFLFFFFNLFETFVYANKNTQIVVRVENELITNFDIKSKIISLLILSNKEMNQQNINQLKRISLENLIQSRLKKNELKNFNFKTNKDQLDSYLKSISANNINALKKQLVENGVDYDAFIEDIDIELKWRQFIYQKYSNKIKINLSDVDKELKEIINKQQSLKEFSLSEIEILSTDKTLDNAKILQVKEEINNSNFENAVIKYSISSTAMNKGKLGWINSSSLSKEILKILDNMKIGEVSKPIRKQNKIIFLRLNDKKNLSYTKENIKLLEESILNKKKNELFNLYSNSYISKLKNSSFIEYINDK